MKLTNLHILPALIALCIAWAATSCIEDEVSTNPAHQPQFSVDTLHFGTVFTDQMAPTAAFMVYNPTDKVMSIASIAFRDGGTGRFRINVDGRSGSSFSNIEIRPNDSIYVLASVIPAPNGSFAPVDVNDLLDFTVNGVRSTVVLSAKAQDVERVTDAIIDVDTHWTADRPRQIFGTLEIAPGATLTIDPGVTLYLHDGAQIVVSGTLVANGSPEAPIQMRGDRLDNILTDVSYDLMSRQWGGIYFTPSSTANVMRHTEVRNTDYGVIVDSVPLSATPALTLINCRLRNSHANALAARHSWIQAVGTEFAEAAQGSVMLIGGRADINHCTISNYYLFSSISGAALQLYHTHPDNADPDTPSLPFLRASVTNTIIYASSADLNLKSLDDTNVYLTRCLLRSNGTDDDHFINTIWGQDPLFYTVRADYIFDYRLHPESPALNAADPTFDASLPAVDFYGFPRPRPAAIGAMELKAEN